MGAEGCHNSNVPPPFLTKTYEMVDDPATDEIVSWSDNNSSFVVWNVADFTKDLLPQYFKHNNFSSFVRQLNTYGFHKIDPDRQEFANEVFCKGNKEALKCIHRRKPAASHTHSLQSQKELPLIGCSDPAHTELEEEIKRLKQDKGLLLSELLQVRKVQQTTETELDELAHRFQALEERQQHMLAFVERALLLNPSMAEFVQPSGSLAFSKKRRLPAKETFIGIGESWGEDGGQLFRYNSEGVSGGESSYEQPGNVLSNGPLVKSEGVSGAESSYEQILKQFAVSTLNQSDETSPLSRTSGVIPWKMHGPGGEHATNVDLAGYGMATQSATASPNEAAECSDSACQRRSCADLQVGSSAHSVNSDYEEDPEDEKPAHVHVKGGTEVSKAGGSNDGFWESMLTENPHLMQKDSENTKEGFLNERWFF